LGHDKLELELGRCRTATARDCRLTRKRSYYQQACGRSSGLAQGVASSALRSPRVSSSQEAARIGFAIASARSASFPRAVRTQLSMARRPSEDELRQYGGSFDLREVKRLNFSGQQICDLGPISRMLGLLTLDLSNNLLTSLKGIECLVSLRHLDISGNRLQSLRGLDALKMLESLSAVDCGVQQLQPGVIPFLSALPQLKQIRFRPYGASPLPPLCKEPGYPEVLLQNLPALEQCDQLRIVLRGPARPELLETDFVSETEIRIPERTPWRIADLELPGTGVTAKTRLDVEKRFAAVLSECKAKCESAS